MHSLILGITGTGKTTLAFVFAKHCRAQGIPVFVLDPDMRQEWGVPCLDDLIKNNSSLNTGFVTDNPEKFLEFCKVNQKCALFIDEAGAGIGKYAGEMTWCATNSRKWGHKAYFITQRATQLDVNIRTQCSSVFVFQQSRNDCKILAIEFNRPELEGACDLVKGEYLCKLGVDGQIKRGKAW